MTPRQKKEWEKIRSKGRKNYIWKRMIPVGAVIGFLHPIATYIYEYGFDFPQELSQKHLLLVSLSVIFYTILFYFLAVMSWKDNERKYLDDKPCITPQYLIERIRIWLNKKFGSYKI